MFHVCDDDECVCAHATSQATTKRDEKNDFHDDPHSSQLNSLCSGRRRRTTIVDFMAKNSGFSNHPKTIKAQSTLIITWLLAGGLRNAHFLSLGFWGGRKMRIAKTNWNFIFIENTHVALTRFSTQNSSSRNLPCAVCINEGDRVSTMGVEMANTELFENEFGGLSILTKMAAIAWVRFPCHCQCAEATEVLGSHLAEVFLMQSLCSATRMVN